jgi:multiple antibiotic resistance protein
MGTFATYTLLCFGSLFSIVDPFATLPIFIAIVSGEGKASRERTALRASFTVLAILTAFGLAGSVIFAFFGITIPAFKIAGGVLLFMVGLDMMRAKQSDTRSTEEERHDAVEKEDVGVIPLGIPLLSGPGSIASVMVLTGKAKSIDERIGLHVAIVAVAVSTFLILRSASFFARVLGRTGINLIGRIMGLILSATATQFVIDGAREAFGLAHP